MLVFILSLLIMSSCGQQETSQKILQTTTNSFKAEVNGKSYKAIHVSGFISPVSKTLLLTGAMGTGEDIQLFLPKDITAGTYDFSTIQGKYQENEEKSGFAVRGNVIIIAHDTTNTSIKGSFYFTTKPLLEGHPSFDITEGNFDITY